MDLHVVVCVPRKTSIFGVNIQHTDTHTHFHESVHNQTIIAKNGVTISLMTEI